MNICLNLWMQSIAVVRKLGQLLYRFPPASKQLLSSLSRRALRWFRHYPGRSTVMVCAFIASVFLLSLMFHGPNQTIDVLASGTNKSGIILLGQVYKLDVVEQTVSICWLIVGCGAEYQVPNTTLYGQSCGRLAIPIDIYIDSSPTPNVTYNPFKTTWRPGGNIVENRIVAEFTTTKLLDINGGHIGGGAAQATYYDVSIGFPWDFYYMITAFIAVNHTDNRTLPILRVAAVNFANNFSPQFDDYPTISQFNGTSSVASRSITVVLHRTPLAKTFNLVILTVNWLLTGVALFITVVTLGKNKVDMVPDTLLLLPLTVILTIPSLRALMVGAPAFGVLIDAVGLFPQMIIVSLCSFLLIAISFKQFNSFNFKQFNKAQGPLDPKPAEEPETAGEIEDGIDSP